MGKWTHNFPVPWENKIYSGRGGNSEEGTDGMLHIHPQGCC